MISLGSIGILMLISLVGAWYYRGKWYYIPILCGVVNLALNWSAFQYIVSFNGEVAAYTAPTQQEAGIIAETINNNPYQITTPSGYSEPYRDEMAEKKSSGAILIDIPPIQPGTAQVLFEKYGPNLENYPSEDGRIQLLDAIERGKKPALSILSFFQPSVTWFIR